MLSAVAEAYAREQLREGFIGKQCQKILKVKQGSSDAKTVKEYILKESSLAANLKQVLESFNARKTVTLRLNNWI